MSVTACPTAVVHAPAAAVWRLLTVPDGYALWAGAELLAVDPPGPATEGQRVDFRSREFGRWWSVGFVIGPVRAPESLQLTVRLPFGVVNREHITLIPVSERETRVTFN